MLFKLGWIDLGWGYAMNTLVGNRDDLSQICSSMMEKEPDNEAVSAKYKGKKA